MPQESFSTDLHPNRRVGPTNVGDAYIARLLPKDDSRPLFARAHRRTRSREASYVSRLGTGTSGRRRGCAERRARGRLFPDAHETIGRSVDQERSEPRSGGRPQGADRSVQRPINSMNHQTTDSGKRFGQGLFAANRRRWCFYRARSQACGVRRTRRIKRLASGWIGMNVAVSCCLVAGGAAGVSAVTTSPYCR